MEAMSSILLRRCLHHFIDRFQASCTCQMQICELKLNFQIVAMEALVRYSYNSRIKDITDLSVEVDLPDSNYTETLYFSGQTDIAKPQR